MARPSIGLLLPTAKPPEALVPTDVLRVAGEAERRGFDAVWVPDHVQWHTAVLDPLCTLAAVAARTSRVNVGTSVLLLPVRHPMLVAGALATIDQLSGGRLLAGFGVGTSGGGDFTATGVDPRRRGARLNRGLRILRALFDGQTVDEPDGDPPLIRARLLPRPKQARIPFLFGGHTPAALRRVAEHGDGWIAAFTRPAKLAGQLTELREACAALGRDPAALEVLALVYVEIDADVARAEQRADRHFRRHYRASAERLRDSSAFGPPAVLRERVAAYRDAGATGFIFGFPSDRYDATLDAISEVAADLETGMLAEREV